jgi:hypothetical protein
VGSMNHWFHLMLNHSEGKPWWPKCLGFAM